MLNRWRTNGEQFEHRSWIFFTPSFERCKSCTEIISGSIRLFFIPTQTNGLETLSGEKKMEIHASLPSRSA